VLALSPTKPRGAVLSLYPPGGPPAEVRLYNCIAASSNQNCSHLSLVCKAAFICAVLSCCRQRAPVSRYLSPPEGGPPKGWVHGKPLRRGEPP
jgi:hypothetical protein